VVFPTLPDETEEAAFDEAAVQARLHKFFPKPGPYPVVHRNIYAVHQRVAASFRKGRAFLAGDSAHVNNPLGGLGLNFGIHDGMERPPCSDASSAKRQRPTFSIFTTGFVGP
jgi:3-(3-hydroxy-phenyl)propionate hydroxylase